MDGDGDLGVAQGDRFIEIVDGQPPDLWSECLRDRDESVAVRIRLDHRNQVRRCDERGECRRVAPNRREIDPEFGEHRYAGAGTRVRRATTSANGRPKKTV